MRPYYIVKYAADVRGNNNHVYTTEEAAIARAKEIASQERRMIVVFKAVTSYAPVADVEEVPFDE